MCRWMAWLGQPVLIEELLFNSPHGIVDQSLHARMGAEPTNGDGFGLGWYGSQPTPAVYRSVAPAWSDANLRELAAHVESGLFLTHVRAAIGSPVQETNCHPFRHGRWLFVHNGFIADFHLIRRDLMLAIDPALFANVTGSTDTEVVFHLALTFGLEDDPIQALERTIGLIESVADRHGVADAVQGELRRVGRHDSVGGALCDQRQGAVPVHVGRPGLSAAPVPRQPPASARHRRRPSGRLGAVLGPSWTLERGSPGDGGHGGPSRGVGGAALPAESGRR